MKNTLTLFFLLILISPLFSQTPAFPGAEGSGSSTTGGRGGTVYYVTNLTDINSGNTATREGSLRWCLNQTGTKTILFKVSGTIFLTSNLSVSKPNVTIAGQSAPGDGICVAGFPVTVSANNVIIRYVRFRMGDKFGISADGADALGGRGYSNIMIDHCSMCWSTDECVSFYGNQNTTIQWCLISESLRLSGHSKGPHGYGGIWGGKNASFHHNLLAHHDSRTPRFGPYTSTQLEETTDMRNCVIYNWSGNGCYGGEAMKINIVNNYYKPGPATPTGSKRGRIYAVDKKTGLSSTDSYYPINDVWGTFYVAGNVIDESTSTSTSDKTVCINATNNNWDYGIYNQISSSYGVTTAEKAAMKSNVPLFDPGEITLHTAENAYEKVVAYAGASLVRDTLDKRIINETITGTAAYKGLSPYNGLGVVTYPAGTVLNGETLTVATTIDWKSISYPKWGIIDSEEDIKPADAASDWSPWPTLNQGTAPADSNIDGIPDNWLESNYPGKTSTDLNEEGYTYLEVYLNSIVENITTEQNKNAIASGVNNPNANNKFEPTVYINPATNKIIIKSEEIIGKVEIYNTKGMLLQTENKNLSSFEMDASSLIQGVYILKIISKGNFDSYIKKILKN